MARNHANTVDEQRKNMEQQWADDAQNKIDELERDLEHYRALRERINDADRDELEALLGPIMSEARHWSPRSIHRVEVRAYFGDEPGEIDQIKFTPLQRGAHTDASGDWTWSIAPDRFLSYRELRRAALDALGHAIGAAERQIENAAERAEKYDHGM